MLLLVIVAVDDLNKFTALGDSTFTFHAVVDGVELKAFVVDDNDDTVDENAPGAALNNGVTGGLIPPVVGVTADLKPTLDWVLFHPLPVTSKLGVVFVIGEFVVDDLKTLLENNEVVVLLPLLLVVVLVIDAGDDDGLIVVNKLVTVTDVGVVGIIDDADDNDEDDGGNDGMNDNDGCNGNTAIGGTSR